MQKLCLISVIVDLSFVFFLLQRIQKMPEVKFDYSGFIIEQFFSILNYAGKYKVSEGLIPIVAKLLSSLLGHDVYTWLGGLGFFLSNVIKIIQSYVGLHYVKYHCYATNDHPKPSVLLTQTKQPEKAPPNPYYQPEISHK